MTYAYNTHGAPAVGGGLPGLPIRQGGKGVSSKDSASWATNFIQGSSLAVAYKPDPTVPGFLLGGTESYNSGNSTQTLALADENMRITHAVELTRLSSPSLNQPSTVLTQSYAIVFSSNYVVVLDAENLTYRFSFTVPSLIFACFEDREGFLRVVHLSENYGTLLMSKFSSEGEKLETFSLQIAHYSSSSSGARVSPNCYYDKDTDSVYLLLRYGTTVSEAGVRAVYVDMPSKFVKTMGGAGTRATLNVSAGVVAHEDNVYFSYTTTSQHVFLTCSKGMPELRQIGINVAESYGNSAAFGLDERTGKLVALLNTSTSSAASQSTLVVDVSDPLSYTAERYYASSSLTSTFVIGDRAFTWNGKVYATDGVRSIHLNPDKPLVLNRNTGGYFAENMTPFSGGRALISTQSVSYTGASVTYNVTFYNSVAVTPVDPSKIKSLRYEGVGFENLDGLQLAFGEFYVP